MKRGELWTVAGGKQYAGKPRPAVIVQESSFSTMDSVIVCLITEEKIDAPLFRIALEPSEKNNLKLPSDLMIDKLSSVPRSKLGKRFGALEDADILRMNRAIAVFLGLGSRA
jgi:mRNA interferase MazF